MRTLDDGALVGLMKQGRQEALGEVMRRHRQQVARVIIGMLGNTPEADDVGQETFIRFWNNMEAYTLDARISTYLTRIAINLSINEIRKRKRKQEWFSNAKSEAGRQVVDETLNERYNMEHIEAALQQLDEQQRAVVVLRLLQGYSTKETAEMLHIPLGTVLSRLSRALDKLRLNLKKLDEI
ncbi:MAG TPA: RNA polymerase sigma factor [Bacteroidales bacterium]|nr:RNA polymerase sigma factor [Bacteroidales bacterium]